MNTAIKSSIKFKSKNALLNTVLVTLVLAIREAYGYPSEISVYAPEQSNRLLLDHDFDDWEYSTLKQVLLGPGAMLVFNDEEGDKDGRVKQTIEFTLEIEESIEQAFQLPLLEVGYKP